MNTITRRHALGALAGAALAGALPASAQSPYPSGPITLIVAFPAGGSTDAVARLVGSKLSQAWKQNVIVENRSGAGGLIGAQRVMSAEPDGYTLLVTNSALVQSALSAPGGKAPYDPVNDFAPVTQLNHAPVVFSINPDLPAKTLAEFVALVKREPGKHSFGSGGIGQTLHLQGALLNMKTGLDMAHVPFKGDAALVSDVMAGHVSSGFATIATARAQIQAGKLRPLAVAGPRSPLLPDVPSMGELGYDGFDAVGWFGMLAPVKTPPPIVDKLADEIARILKMPDVQERLNSLALSPTGGGPAEFKRIIARDYAYWDGVMKAVGTK